MAVASNTTMNHLLLGVDAEALRNEPYVPAFFELRLCCPRWAIQLAPCAGLNLAPDIGSYVGGDITAGTLAGMMWRTGHDLSLLIDLGTNGEIVLGNSEFSGGLRLLGRASFRGRRHQLRHESHRRCYRGLHHRRRHDGASVEVIGGPSAGGPLRLGDHRLIADSLLRHVNGKGKFVREASASS